MSDGTIERMEFEQHRVAGAEMIAFNKADWEAQIERVYKAGYEAAKKDLKDKWPSMERFEAIIKENAQLISDQSNGAFQVDGMDALLYSLVHGRLVEAHNELFGEKTEDKT